MSLLKTIHPEGTQAYGFAQLLSQALAPEEAAPEASLLAFIVVRHDSLKRGNRGESEVEVVKGFGREVKCQPREGGRTRHS
jgi:hypothetical protein